MYSKLQPWEPACLVCLGLQPRLEILVHFHQINEGSREFLTDIHYLEERMVLHHPEPRPTTAGMALSVQELRIAVMAIETYRDLGPTVTILQQICKLLVIVRTLDHRQTDTNEPGRLP